MNYYIWAALQQLVYRRRRIRDVEHLKERKGKRKEVNLYSAFIVATTLKALRRGSHSFTCK